MDRRPAPRQRILIVNAYFDDLGHGAGRPRRIPQAMAPAWLAGAFARERCDVRAYNEQHSGPLRDERVFDWPDMLVLTGLTNAFDRMLQLTAYARSRNPGVIVVAGGPAIRALPRYARQFFDYACTGDVEQMAEVATDAFGPGSAAGEVFPRFDLADWMGPYGYVESSRYCNFRCTFCSLTGERRAYQAYPLEHIRRQMLSLGRRRFVTFLDNNFYGNDGSFFRARMALLQELRHEGRIPHWGALVTSDFFQGDGNLALAAKAGCYALFSGLESFSADVLRGFQKTQNTIVQPEDMIRRCFEAGIVFAYGIMLDFATRTLKDMRAEIESIVANTAIPLPNYFSVTVPLLNTPYFRDCVRRGVLLPSVRLRDMNTGTLTVQPIDPIEEVGAFLRELHGLRRYRHRVPRRTLAFLRRYRRYLTWLQVGITLSGPAMVCAPNMSSGALPRRIPRRRTFVASTEPLDPAYAPAFRVPSRYESYFRPTMVTDASGGLNEDLAGDLWSTASEV